MNLTDNQSAVLQALRSIAHKNLYRYATNSPYLFQQECLKIVKGDHWCVFGMGGLSWHVGKIVNLPTPTVLSIFKQLERRGFVIRETVRVGQGRPLYWWPVGYASQLCAELADSGL